MPLRTAVLIALVAVLAAPTAFADASATGGLAAGEAPRIISVRCIPSAEAPCPAEAVASPGAQVQLRGRGLDGVRTVVFRGGRGRADDVHVRPRHARPTHVEALVPARAASGRIEVRAYGGDRAVSRTAVEVVKSEPAATTSVQPLGPQVFPIRGRHDLGQSPTNDFGGARNHKGQDLFAACGTPLVVAEGGTVRYTATDGRAGNYAVITGGATGRDYVYMHMRAPALVRRGQAVTTGQPLGEVGDSGNADGCHLHFELWSSPGWYEGGAPVDPLPDLRAWDARNGRHAH